MIKSNYLSFNFSSKNRKIGNRAISAKLGNSITVFVLFCILFDR